MTYPRAHLIDANEGVYHICSRCVRRAWLCGTDQQTGFNFDHRRQWLEERILALTAIFAVDLYGYAVMSNHYHLVINLNAALVDSWSDSEVVDKWLSLSSRRHQSTIAASETDLARALLLSNPERVEILRQRLASVSWLMRFINEPLARMANQQDGCKGRFWEGRFKSQRLLDENAVLACMIYVDLNPVRAGMVKDVTEAEHTALSHRLAASVDTAAAITAVDSTEPLPFDRSLGAYIALARWIAESQRSSRRRGTHTIDNSYAPSIDWLAMLMPGPGNWQRACGSTQSLRDYAKSIGQRWIKTHSMGLLV